MTMFWKIKENLRGENYMSGKGKQLLSCYFWHYQLVCNYSYSSLGGFAASSQTLAMQRSKAVSSNQAARSVVSREFLTAGCLHFVQGGTSPAEGLCVGQGCGLAFRAHKSEFKGWRMEVDVFVNWLLQSQ